MGYGKRLLDFRARHNLTQAQLAELFGVSLEMISKYETEKARPRPKNLLKFENKMKEMEAK